MIGERSTKRAMTPKRPWTKTRKKEDMYILAYIISVAVRARGQLPPLRMGHGIRTTPIIDSVYVVLHFTLETLFFASKVRFHDFRDITNQQVTDRVSQKVFMNNTRKSYVALLSYFHDEETYTICRSADEETYTICRSLLSH